MKKNKAMRLATALLVLTLLTTCAISGTFAKYVTGTTGNDSARVAYWGFDQAAATTIDLFDGEYTNVQSSGAVDGYTNVVAPGTSKEETFAFGYTNYKTDAIEAPEVAYDLTVDVTTTGSSTAALDANKNFTWTLQKGETEVGTYQKLDDLVAAIKALSGSANGTQRYQAGQLPEAFTSADEVYTIGWNWEFSTAAEADGTDTEMGNAQTLDHVALTITITATQVD